eukprot:SAG31_NODE_496_length_14862_cov_9.280837_18_plen_100_part_00
MSWSNVVATGVFPAASAAVSSHRLSSPVQVAEVDFGSYHGPPALQNSVWMVNAELTLWHPSQPLVPAFHPLDEFGPRVSCTIFLPFITQPGRQAMQVNV